ncbi:MAG TPA: hypothetical protein VFW28_13640 [Micropepsaceae bacterium]|nr:hypothetical protein [Micropepsaceae bacterium]
MRSLRFVMVPALAFSLSACATMINGVDISPHPAQGGDSFCERNMVLCIGGGLLLAGGIALVAAGGHGSGMGGY